MIPGKKYKPEDLIEGAWRRRWFIVIPVVVISVLTMAVVSRLPDRYESSATLLIVPQRIPEAYVRSAVVTRLDERLMAIGQTILSRNNLEKLIRDFNLYPEERRSMIMEDVVEMMRLRDIVLNTRNARADSGSFGVSFEYSDPRIAQQVAERLGKLFIDENIQDRFLLADVTDQFLGGQLQEVELKLKEREKQLEDFRRSHPGAMPTQVESNQQALQNTQLNLQAVQEAITRDRDRQVIVQRQLADLALAASMAPLPAAAGQDKAPQSYAQQLEGARDLMKNLRMRLTADHPDIKALTRTIKDLEQKAALEASQGPVSGPMNGASPAELSRASRLSDLQLEETTLQRRITQRQEDERQLLGAMSSLRSRLEASPGVESQLTELMRDYTTLQAQYTGLLSKSQDAKVAASLERSSNGEQFKIIDEARVPQRPKSPDRMRLNLLGAVGGLMVGLGFAALLEYRDTSVRTDDDVLVALALPVLATVPTMRTDLDRKRQKRQKMWIASSSAVALMLCLAAIMWKLRINEWMW